MNPAGKNKRWYFFTQRVIKLQIFLPPDILWMLEVYTGQIHKEKRIEDYCNDITFRSVLASGSDQDKNTMHEILEGNFCRMPVYIASASNAE